MTTLRQARDLVENFPTQFDKIQTLLFVTAVAMTTIACAAIGVLLVAVFHES